MNFKLSIFYRFLLLFLYCRSNNAINNIDLDEAKTAIRYVTGVEDSTNCTGGTEHTLRLVFDHSKWSEYARVAMVTANLLTKLIQKGDGRTLSTIDDNVLFDLVRNNIRSDVIVFGSAIAFEEGVFANKTRYCPYAHMNGSETNAFDLAQGYDYFADNVEWYHTLKIRDWGNMTLAVDYVDTGSGRKKHITPVGQLSEGHWTYPYYDCGGGNIWMATYSLPFFSYDELAQLPIFSGIATIDIELTNIDINQCEREEEEEFASLDVFRGTHHCQPTTYCSPLSGQGFKRGSYICVCTDGHYSPNAVSEQQGFHGKVLEEYFDKRNSTGPPTHKFMCLKCSRGCDICNDSSPCMIEHNLVTRAAVVAFSTFTLIFTVMISATIYLHRQTQILKSASPIFLQIMCAGSALICLQMFLGFNEPNNAVCIVRAWFSVIGFFLIYGALLLKTYRVSAIFRKTTQRVHMPDHVLMKFFVPILGVVVVFLATWTGITAPSAMIFVTDNGLKYIDCSWDSWNYTAFAGEGVFLLWGVYLSFTVRKAPSHFNESKYITWSIYNAVILGSFVIIITQFVAAPIGPDVVYTTQFGQILVRVIITLCLIFLPKFHILYKKEGDITDENITGRIAPRLPTVTSIVEASLVHNVAVQTDDMCSCAMSSHSNNKFRPESFHSQLLNAAPK